MIFQYSILVKELFFIAIKQVFGTHGEPIAVQKEGK